ncbi:GGDEF domain-containing protein [Photobacterium sanctipauli]|uniref:diguanylate cyclase n=1 Tax=Photobacterium sanctipauli TaxID=1342794 RepID=A0A2T3NVG6_9GAMM|nr:GGDEF domain-containing protein [Photobacterium sanctipauli]PSW20270.1 GGDEF domain-containing protein [Photobacterium sanctipauli]
MGTLSQLPLRLTVVVCIGILLSALVPSNGQLDIIVSILTLVLIIMLLKEDFGTEMRSWLILALGTYSIGVIADLLDEVPELDNHWLIDSTDDIFMHIGVFLICFCFIKMLNQRRELISKLQVQIDKSRKFEADLSRLALEDELTGLQNRRALFRRFDKIAINLQRGILAYIDLDNFKQVNDNFGHKCGDELLTAIAKMLVQTAPIGSHIYRIGGDEFVVLLPTEDNQLCQTWITDLYEATHPKRAHYNIDLSIGLSPYYPGNLSDPGAILTKADKAMYKAKLNKQTAL